jgi:hypothetical protein
MTTLSPCCRACASSARCWFAAAMRSAVASASYANLAAGGRQASCASSSALRRRQRSACVRVRNTVSRGDECTCSKGE